MQAEKSKFKRGMLKISLEESLFNTEALVGD
jgi:hypothetical protein